MEPLPTHDPETILEHARGLRSLATRLVGSERAEDLVQDTFLTALEKPPTTDRPLGPWLVRVLINRSHSLMRRSARRRETEVLRSDPCAVPSAAEINEELDAAERLLQAVGRLQPPRSTIVSMRYFRELSSREIAEALSMPAPTVRWHLQQAMAALRLDLAARERQRPGGWVAALAPLLRVPVPPPVEGAAPVGGVGGWAAGGAAAAALAVVGTVAWVTSGSPGTAPPLELGPADRGAAVSALESVPPGRVRDALLARRETAAGAEPLAPTSAPWAWDQTPVEDRVQVTVRARIVGPDGTPAPLAELRCTGGDQPFATADGDGQCVLRLVAPHAAPKGSSIGDLLDTLSYHAPGLGELPVGPLGFEGVDIDLGTLRLEQGHPLEGTVVDHAGRPAPDVRVVALVGNAAADRLLAGLAPFGPDRLPGAEEVHSDGKGAFRFDALHGSTVTLVALTESGVPTSLAMAKLPAEAPAQLLFDRPPVQDRRVRVLDPEGRPVAGALVGTTFGASVADDDGRTAPLLLPPVPGRIECWDAEGRFPPAFVTVDPAQGGELTVTLEAGLRVPVAITDPTGRPVGAAEWQLEFAGVRRTGRWTGDGFTLALPNAEQEGHRWKRADLRVQTEDGRTGSVRLDRRRLPARVDLTLAPLVAIKGAVVGAEGPLEGAVVCITEVVAPRSLGQRPEPPRSRTLRTGPSGRFEWLVPVGTEVGVTAYAPGRGLARTQVATTAGDGHELTLRPEATGSIVGHLDPFALVDLSRSEGPPTVPSIRATGPGGATVEAAIDGFGSVRLEGLTAGTWSVRPIPEVDEGGERPFAPATVEVVAGRVVHVDLARGSATPAERQR